MPSSGVLPHGVRQPTLTVEALLASLASFNSKVKQQMDVRQEEALEQDTWAETLKELDEGWIWKDSSQSWEGKCVARRFGIHQGGKTRVIDDCSVCGLNQTVGLKEKFVLQAVHQMCTILCWSLQQAQPGEHPPIVGRTFDLKSAYKQFGLRKSDRDLLRIAVVDATHGKPMLCGLNALPFGGVGSVAGFLRVSLATWFTGMAGLKLCWTGYFDDFSTITRPELQNNTAWAVDSLFSLIGLDYAREGAKAPEFSTTFKMLGVQVDAFKAQQHVISVGHTVERKLELGQAFDDALTAGKLSTKLAERLRGRMVFYECFAAGRTTNRGSSEDLVARGSQMVDIPWGELLSCLPSPNGGEDGESRQKPRGLKKGVPPSQHVSLLDFEFQCGHVGVCLMCVFHFGHFTADRRRRLAYLFSWYYRHTYMSWYIDMYMIYITDCFDILNIDVCDATLVGCLVFTWQV